MKGTSDFLHKEALFTGCIIDRQMKKKTEFKLKIYPFIVGISPVLILFASNVGEVKFSEVIRSFLIAILLTAFFILAGWVVFRNVPKASLLASFIMISVLAYGHVYDGLKEIEWLVPFIRHRLLLALNALLILGLGWLLWKRIKKVEALESFFTWFSVFILLFPLYKIGDYDLFSQVGLTKQNIVPQSESLVIQNGAKPDIYYIILDGYGREDILKELYGFDNFEFVNELSQLGFYVAPEATSNYSQTLLSLGSSMNFQYVDDTLLTVDPSSGDRRELTDRILHSRIRQILTENGYKFVSFDNGFVTSVEDADIYYEHRGPQSQGRSMFLAMNAFESLLFEQSILRPLLNTGILSQESLKKTLNDRYIRHADRILFSFEKLAQIPAMDGDYFVFAHILAPHPPFVFGRNGEFISHTKAFILGDALEFASTPNGTREEYMQGYTNQMVYVNSLVLRTVKTILSESKTPPIIIIQGDHGPGAYLDWKSRENTNVHERFSILEAYYFAGRKSTSLYPSISPVNTFRVILNDFFEAHLELLPDKNYYSRYFQPYQFYDVTDDVTGR